MHLSALWSVFALAGLLVLPAIAAPPTAALLRDELSSLSPREKAHVAEILVQHLAKRSNPSGSYAPTKLTECPAAFNSSEPGGMTGYIRNASSQQISSQEADYIERHRKGMQSSWTDWLKSASPGPDLTSIPGGVDNFTQTLSNIPRVAIAVSGGGYRAMLYGAGVVQGLDNRNMTAVSRGIGGVLQRADYFAGLSGGSWLTGALAINDWPTPQQLNDEIFNLESNLVIPSDGKTSFYADIATEVEAKKNEGYPTSLTDFWGRALSYHLLNNTKYPDHGAATTWSDIVNVTSFQNASYPFPVVMADEQEPGDILVYGNTTIWEFNPFETGTWDRIEGFVPTELLGSNMTNGQITSCVEGYDSFGFVVGTSSTLFNELFDMLITSDGDSVIKAALTAITGAVAADDNDVSQIPNPFQGYKNGVNSSAISDATYATLVDGGEDDQNIPLWPLLQPARNLDFILALDSSADETDWPNGTALWETTLRATTAGFTEVPVPYFPPPETFVNRGLNTRPVFFGCNATNATNAKTAAHGVKAPIVAYIPNYPYLGLSNFSTYKLEYQADESQLMLDNGVAIATLNGNNATWSQCLACGMLERSWERSGVARPQECTDCMQQYCWDGEEDNAAPANPYSPPVGLPEWVSDSSVQKTPAYTGGNGSSSTNTDTESSNAEPLATRTFGVAASCILVASTWLLF